MALLLFQLTAKGILGVFLLKFAHFGLLFRIWLPVFFIFLLIFCFVDFSCQRMLGLFLDEITDFWLVFQIYLLVFAK